MCAVVVECASRAKLSRPSFSKLSTVLIIFSRCREGRRCTVENSKSDPIDPIACIDRIEGIRLRMDASGPMLRMDASGPMPATLA